MIEEAVFARLSATAGLTTLVGTRIVPRLNFQDTAYPCVSYMLVSAQRESAMGSDPGLVHSRYQVEAWDIDRTSVRNVVKQIRAALQRWRGTDTNNGTTVIQDAFIDNVIEPGPELVDAVTVFHTIVEVVIHHTE